MRPTCEGDEYMTPPEVWEEVIVRNKGDRDLEAIQAVASMRCSRCKRWHNKVYLYGSPAEMSNFCPNCGADMRGEKDD